MEKCNSKQILQMLQELKDDINSVGDNFPECDNSLEIDNAAERIESAVLAAAIMIAQPANPQKAITDAYSAVEAFRAEQKKQEQAEIQKRLKEWHASHVDFDEDDDEDEDEE